MITAGRIGRAEAILLPGGIDERRTATVVALEEEHAGKIKVRLAGAAGHVDIVDVDSISWDEPQPFKTNGRIRWWDAPLDVHGPFLPLEFVFTVATLAERNNVALDVAYISASGEPVDVEAAEVLDLRYAANALLVQAADPKRPVSVVRQLEELLDLGPAINAEAYNQVLTEQRVLIPIPLEQVLSIRLRPPSTAELTECHCAYQLDAPNGYRKCAYCKQLEEAAQFMAAENDA